MKGITLHSVRGWHRFPTCVRRTGYKCATSLAGPGPRGFTLVEMLVVISVIAILLTLVVGVTHIVLGRAGAEQTKANMQIIHQAIDEYRIANNGALPPDETDFSGRPVIGEFAPETTPGREAEEARRYRNWQAYCRGKKLYDELILVPQSQAFVAKLKKGAIKNIEGNDVFVDGFDKYMEYYSDKGIGGEPVIISAGADSKFDTEKDIRSDNQ